MVHVNVRHKKPQKYWSRFHRRKVSLLKAGSDPCQSKLSAYYSELASKAAQAVEQHCDSSHLLNEAKCKIEPSNSLSVLFQKLICNAEQNYLKLPQQRRPDFVIKKFATSLLVHWHTHFCIVTCLKLCLRTVQRIIFDEHKIISGVSLDLMS